MTGNRYPPKKQITRLPWKQRGGTFTLDSERLRKDQEEDTKRTGIKFVGFMLWQYLLHGRNRR